MLVVCEKPSRHLTSMLFWLWTLHNKLSEKTKALSILSLTNIIQAKFLMKTLLLALVKPMFADRWWSLQSWDTWEKAALPPHPRVNKTAPLWTFLFCSVFCIWTARSSEVRTPLKNFSPHHNRFYLTQLPLSPNFTTSPSRLEEFYSVKQTSETNTSSFCNLCTLCVLTVAHFSFHDHCLTSLPLIGLKVPQGWDLIYFCILSAKSRSLHIWATSKACNDQYFGSPTG